MAPAPDILLLQLLPNRAMTLAVVVEEGRRITLGAWNQVSTSWSGRPQQSAQSAGDLLCLGQRYHLAASFTKIPELRILERFRIPPTTKTTSAWFHFSRWHESPTVQQVLAFISQQTRDIWSLLCCKEWWFCKKDMEFCKKDMERSSQEGSACPRNSPGFAEICWL